MGGGITLQISIAAPLSKATPTCVLYILDPEPELFALATAHIYGRYGYDSDDCAEASVMRQCVLVGVGHDPSHFKATPTSWKVQNLRDLRRRHFLRGEGRFLHYMCHELPRMEPMFGLPPGITRQRRALLGCSLSSLLALRTVLRPSRPSAPSGGDVFGCVILGSPSLPLCQGLLDEAQEVADTAAGAATAAKAKAKAATVAHSVSALFVVGEREATCSNEANEVRQLRQRLGLELSTQIGNGIPAAASEMARLLRGAGHVADEPVVVVGENHASLKPSLVSRGVGWLETVWAKPVATSPAATSTAAISPVAIPPMASSSVASVPSVPETLEADAESEVVPVEEGSAPTSLLTILEIDGLAERVLFLLPPRELLPMCAVSTAVNSATSRAVDDRNGHGYWGWWLDTDYRWSDVADPSTTRVITEWRNDEHGDWFCYWDGTSYGMPQDREANFVFRPPLEMTPAGDVRPSRPALRATAPTAEVAAPAGAGVPAAPAVPAGPADPADPVLPAVAGKELYRLLARLHAISVLPGNAVGWGDEASYAWERLVVPWNEPLPSEHAVLTPQALLWKLGAHEELLHACRETEPVSSDDVDDEPTPFGAALQAFLAAHQETAVFYTGSDQLNPVPCFAVAKVLPNLVAGFIGGVVHT